MKNTHGKCCIIPSSSPTALWHPSVISEDFPLREQPSLGWYEAATLPFPVNFLLPPPPTHPSLSPQHQQRPHSPPLSCDSFKSGEQGALDTGGHQPQSTSNLDRWEAGQHHRVDPDLWVGWAAKLTGKTVGCLVCFGGKGCWSQSEY